MKPDMISLYWRMPKMDGVKVGKAIRKMPSNAVNLIYIVMPAVFLEDAAQQAEFQRVMENPMDAA